MRFSSSLPAAVFATLLLHTTGVLAQRSFDNGVDDFAGFSDAQSRILALESGASGKGQKDAVISIMLSPNDQDRQLAVFPDGNAWRMFSELWNKAKASTTQSLPQTKGGFDVGELDVYGTGGYFRVYKFDTGIIQFDIVGGVNNDRMLFERTFDLDPSLFDSFDRKVAEISKTLDAAP